MRFSMAFSVPLGQSDFLRIRRGSASYVDKTAALIPIVTSGTAVYSFTRPRRFGKSTFLSTVEVFFQLPELLGEDAAVHFRDLAVWSSEQARAELGRYAVLSLSFKDAVGQSWGDTRELLRGHLGEVLRRWLPPSGGTEVPERLRHALEGALMEDAPDMKLARAVQWLCEMLHTATGRPVVLLIDEYDSPLHAAWQNGYLPQALDFFRVLMGAALKDNRHLHKAVVTGVLRVARESLFSGVNHLKVCSVLGAEFADTFGFTQPEVEALTVQAGCPERMPEIEAWYNGYSIGGVRLYNPWSVLSFLDAPQRPPLPYWVNTGGTGLIESLLDQMGTQVWEVVEALLSGGTVTSVLDDNLVFTDLHERADAVWSLLLAAGYLKPVSLEVEEGEQRAVLTIPNRELRFSWRQIAARKLRNAMRGPSAVDALTRAMLAGDEVNFAMHLRYLAMNALSYHDTAGDWPERVWQAFVLGILVHLDADYEVRSNLELGYGRADVIVRPRQPGRAGAVLELKRIEPGQDVEAALTGALQQLEDRGYAQGMAGVASAVVEIAVVFEGKKPSVRVKRAG